MYFTSLGFTLLEVVVSLFIISLMLLGLDAMEVFALRVNMNINDKETASQQIQNIEERLRMLGGKTAINEQVNQWNQQNQSILPQVKGIVSGQYPSYVITLCWGEWKEKEERIHSGCMTESFII